MLTACVRRSRPTPYARSDGHERQAPGHRANQDRRSDWVPRPPTTLRAYHVGEEAHFVRDHASALAGVTPAASARIEEDRPSTNPPANSREWYGHPIVLIDGAAIGAIVGAPTLKGDTSTATLSVVMGTLGVGVYFLGGPIVHFRHKRVGAGFAVIAYRPVPRAGIELNMVPLHDPASGYAGAALNGAWQWSAKRTSRHGSVLQGLPYQARAAMMPVAAAPGSECGRRSASDVHSLGIMLPPHMARVAAPRGTGVRV